MSKNTKLLLVGDVFELKKGTSVYVEMPMKYIYDNSNSNSLCEDQIKIGGKTRRSPRSSPRFDTGVYAGEYVVESAKLTGGGTGHGPHDIYPDGHEIIARQLKNGKYDPKGRTVRFYQSGCFTVVLGPELVPPIRTMKRTVDFK